MKKLKIIKRDNFMYTFIDDKNKEYTINIEFQDIDTLPKINDYIYISEKLLDKNYQEYSNIYTFGPLDSSYGRIIDDENNPDIIRIDIGKNSIYLKRLYG
ncbi:MAG: hypothetical protein VZS44_02915 [Bacilli bacterium]|nr:hypothetical protein [Bacilli bacterium]